MFKIYGTALKCLLSFFYVAYNFYYLCVIEPNDCVLIGENLRKLYQKFFPINIQNFTCKSLYVSVDSDHVLKALIITISSYNC